jgi:Protein of unknown function (DUF3048) N-terminal domain/Protein of unknown function (DUF3048) C-terminal domain
MRSRATGFVAVLLVALLAAACSDDEPVTAEQPAVGEHKQRAPEPTCIDGTKASESKIHRPAVALKIENSSEARPQSGLESADVVYEEIVEGGITRFMAIYHCGEAHTAGPVRSARFDDAKIASPFTRLLAYSGANGIVERELGKQKIVSLTELNGGSAFFRVPPGTTDIHSLFADTEKIRHQAPKKLEEPKQGIFEFGAVNDAAKKARRVSLHFNASNTIEYRWSGGTWKRSEAGQPFMSNTGGQIEVANLVVQQVEVNNSATIVDPIGNPSPDIALKGKGKAVLFRDGRVVKGTWVIKKEGDAATFETKSGKPFVFTPGPIWIELLPSGKGEVKGSFEYR